MPYYNRRDLIGHWIRKKQRAQQPCTHACCRGYRVHPANMPVILPDRTLHQASEEDLAAHFDRVSAEDSAQAQRVEAQILHEMERRDRLERRRRETRRAREASREAGQRARRATRAAQEMEREAEQHRLELAAEEYTKGYLVTAEGRSRGILDRDILRGRERVFVRYATPEAKAFFASNPRPTAAYLRQGRDTSILYSDPGVSRRTRLRNRRAVRP